MQQDPRARNARTFALAGAAMVLWSGAGAVIGYVAGTSSGAFEGPPTVHFSISGGVAPPDALAQFPSSAPIGIAYVAPIQGYVATADADEGTPVPPGYLVPVSPSSVPAGGARAVCPGLIGGVFYPGEGPTVFTECFSGTRNASLLELNATTLEPSANISLGTEPGITHFAEDVAGQRLFITGYDRELRVIDLAGAGLAATVPLPGGASGGLWYDPGDGRLIAGDELNATLFTVDPASGSVLSTLPIRGAPTVMIGDASTNRLYVVYAMASSDPTNGVLVLNASTLAVEATVPLTGWAYYYAFLDPPRDTVVISDGEGAYFLNESTNSAVAAGGSIGFGSGALAFDPANDQFALLTNFYGCSGGGCVVLSHISQSTSAAPPFSAVPYLGTGTPWYLGGLGIVAGLGVLVATAVWSRPRPANAGDSSDAEFDDPVREADEIESARKRWLTEAEEQSPGKR